MDILGDPADYMTKSASTSHDKQGSERDWPGSVEPQDTHACMLLRVLLARRHLI